MFHKKWRSLASLMLMVSIFAGCGGGGGDSSTPTATTNPPSSPTGTTSLAKKASDYTGTWVGTYQTNVIANEPFTLYVSYTDDTTGTATGTFVSKHIIGTIAGTFNSSTGNMDFALTQNSGVTGSFTGNFSKTNSGLSLGTLTGLNTYGNSTTGSGSCTAPAAATAGAPSFAGVWTGTCKGGVMFGTQDPSDTAVAVLAADGAGGYAGILTTANNTIYGTFTVEKLSGYWFAFLSQPDPSKPGYTIINMTTQSGFDTSVPEISGNPVDILNLTLTGYKKDSGSTNSSQYNLVLHNYDISKALQGNWNYTSTALAGYQSVTAGGLLLSSSDNIHFSGNVALTLTHSDGSTSVTTAPVSGTFTSDMQLTGNPFPLTVGTPTVTGAGGGVSNLLVSVASANISPRVATVTISYQLPGALTMSSGNFYMTAQ